MVLEKTLEWGGEEEKEEGGSESTLGDELCSPGQILGTQEAPSRGTFKISRNKHPMDQTEAINEVPLGFFSLQHFILETTVFSSYDACNSTDRIDSPSRGANDRSF